MHSAELSKLNRIAGQIEGIKKMITDHRDCTEVLTQLRAVRSALKTVEANVRECALNSPARILVEIRRYHCTRRLIMSKQRIEVLTCTMSL